jgi:plasmid stability protein
MASLVVRNLDQRIVDALDQRAARHRRSVAAEHRWALAFLEESIYASKPGA